MSDSLILAADAEAEREDSQLLLFYHEQLPKMDHSKPPGCYTGEKFWKERPDDYRMIVRMLGDPVISKRQICRIFNLHNLTLAAIEEREATPIDTHKKATAKVLALVSHSSAEKMLELVPTMTDGAKVAVVHGIATEKLQLLTGEATTRIEGIGDGRELHRKFAELHEAIMKEAKAREISSHISDDGGNGAPKALALGDRSESGESASATGQKEESDGKNSAL